MKRIAFIFMMAATIMTGIAAERYNFRNSDAYRALSDPDRQKLEQVRRDQFLIWGALDLYCDEHDGPPETLDALVPNYLRELPADPFATAESISKQQKPGGYTTSKKGAGYHYMKGSSKNRAWIIRSVGLPKFPFLGENNSGLYICKGTWISGHNL